MLRIKEIRKQKKITAKEIADYVNVAESTMSLYENGKREPDYNTLLKIAEFLNVSIPIVVQVFEELLSGRSPPVLPQIINGFLK